MTKNPAKNKEKQLWIVLGVVFVVAAALLRFLMLDNKPIHFDESINMWFVKRIWEEGFFTYDPTNYHGPLMFYLIHFFQLFTGFDFISTRWAASIFSFLTLVILWWGPIQQRTAFRWAALFMLLSPAMGFYGRSGIHEAVFVFFQVLGFLSFHFLVAKEFKKFWLTFTGGLLGMMALKETFVILILACGPAMLLAWFIQRDELSLKAWSRDLKNSFMQKDVSTPIVLMILFFFFGLFGGFGAHLKGISDFFVALAPWLKTGVHGAGHEKEFLHWTKLMGKNEYASLVGFFAGLVFIRKNKWILFYTVFALVLWLIYSWIPYKTPWCVISILWPFSMVAGFAMDELSQKLQGAKWAAVIALLVAIFVGESVQMYNILYRDPIDMEHLYVYVNSTYQMKEFIAKTQELIKEQPLLREKPVQIGTEESWPIPIVFSAFYTLDYQKYANELAPDALIYMVDFNDKKVFEDKLKERLKEKVTDYQGFTLDARQGRGHILIYVQKVYFQNRFSWPLQEVGTL